MSPSEGNSSQPDDAASPNQAASVPAWRRALPLLVIVAAIILVFATGLHRWLSFDVLAENRRVIGEFVATNPVFAAIGFVVLYAVVVALSIPGAVILTLAGGFLFGVVQGSVLVVIGATLGAIGIFIAARTALADLLRARAGPWVARLEEGFRQNAFSYLLVLRLVPLFPFWLVNLVPAFLGVSLRTYAVATLIGIMPGSVVYVSVGNGLGAVFDAGGSPDLSIIFAPEILLPILGLALLSLIPVLYRRLKPENGGNS